MLFVRLDNEATFFSSVIKDDLLCGKVNQTGVCLDDAIVTCDDQGFRIDKDCREDQLSCPLSEAEKPMCACTCNEQDFCEESCPCDPDCSCSCDTTAACDQGCACDAACQQPALDAGVLDQSVTSPPADAAAVTETSPESGCRVVDASDLHPHASSTPCVLLLVGLFFLRRWGRR